MKKTLHFLTATLAAMVCLTADAQTVPSLINYQGQLLDAGGNPMPTADTDIEVRLFPVDSGGTAIWGPQVFNGQSGTGLGPKVAVVQGRFNLVLGPQDTIGRDLAMVFAANPSVFLELKVGTASPISPRQQMLAAPFAFTAANAANAANAVNAANAANVLAGGVGTLALADAAITAAKLDPAIGVWTRTGDNVFRSAGNVGIGTSNPEFPLDVHGTMIIRKEGAGAVALYLGIERSWAFRQAGAGAGTALELASVGGGGNKSFIINTTGFVGLGRNPLANKLEVEGLASKTTAGSWLANSDARIKTDVHTVTGALEKLERVRPVQFRYTDEYRARHPSIEDRSYLNVVAQEFQQVFPEAVKQSGDKLPNGDDILQVDTYPLTIYSAAAIQELNQKVEVGRQKAEARVQKLEAENAELKARLERLERLVTTGAANGQ